MCLSIELSRTFIQVPELLVFLTVIRSSCQVKMRW